MGLLAVPGLQFHLAPGYFVKQRLPSIPSRGRKWWRDFQFKPPRRLAISYGRRWKPSTIYPVGTCKMGHNNSAVLDRERRVQGVGGLRAVDGGVIPAIGSGNTGALTILIVEKGADLIKKAPDASTRVHGRL